MASTAAREPVWTTQTRMRMTEGRMRGIDNSMWAYRVVPMSPVVDAKSPEKMVSASVPLMNALTELSRLASTGGSRRAFNRSSYREVHLLAINIPAPYQPPRDSSIHEMLRSDFRHLDVDRRMVLLGVKVNPQMARKGKSAVRAALESVTESLVTGAIPVEDFERDYAIVDAALSRAGLTKPTSEQIQLAESWWDFGKSSDVITQPHADHIHVHTTVAAAKAAKNLEDSGVACETWRIRGSYALTFASVSELDLPWIPATDHRALWAADLIMAGARCVSVRGLVEPAKVTRGELARRRDQYLKDINDRVAAGKSTKADQEQSYATLEQVEAGYATSGGTATLTNTSIVVALDGIHDDVGEVARESAARLGSLKFRQQHAWTEQMLCSPVRSNPHPQDLPIQSIAASGIVSLSTVGDKDGALLGLTELDRQPAYVSPAAVSESDSFPLLALLGSTGSGKSVALMHMARQWAKIETANGEKTPVIVIDPKPKSDFSEAVEASDGQVYSLDSLARADGVFDPLRVVDNHEEAIELASSMIGDINPWPSHLKQGFEVPLIKALRYGVERGATCMGQALAIAQAETTLPDGLVKPIFDLMDATPMFRAIFGREPGGNALRTAQGLTLIKVGAMTLNLPREGQRDPSLSQRIGSWVVRMMVYGSAAAVSGRQGVVILDEAWQFVQGEAGGDEVRRLGRLARSMQVLPVLASQRVSDFIDAQLAGYISRGIILPLDRGQGTFNERTGARDDGQAGHAMDLFRIARTDERLARLAASKFLEGEGELPNWASQHALRDPETKEVIRGSVALYVDLTGRVVPVEIIVPSSYFKLISTRASEVRAREAARAVRLRAQDEGHDSVDGEDQWT